MRYVSKGFSPSDWARGTVLIAANSLKEAGYTQCEYASDYLGTREVFSNGVDNIVIEIKVLQPLTNTSSSAKI